jgi:hypothetical protein
MKKFLASLLRQRDRGTEEGKQILLSEGAYCNLSEGAALPQVRRDSGLFFNLLVVASGLQVARAAAAARPPRHCHRDTEPCSEPLSPRLSTVTTG